MANRLHWSQGKWGRGNIYQDGSIETWPGDDERSGSVADFHITPEGGIHNLQNRSGRPDHHLIADLCHADQSLFSSMQGDHTVTTKTSASFYDFPETNRWQLNIGNADAEHLQQWMLRNSELPFQAVTAKGGWEGQPEPSAALHLYEASPEQAHELLNAYGREHPDEEAFAVIPRGQEPFLHWNPPESHGQLPMWGQLPLDAQDRLSRKCASLVALVAPEGSDRIRAGRQRPERSLQEREKALSMKYSDMGAMHAELKIPQATCKKIRKWVDSLDWPEGSEKEDQRNYHITILTFDEYSEEFIEWMSKEMKGHGPFEFTSDGLDVFGDTVVLRLSCPSWREMAMEWGDTAYGRSLGPRRFPGGPKAHVTVGFKADKKPRGIQDPYIGFSTAEFNVNINKTSALSPSLISAAYKALTSEQGGGNVNTIVTRIMAELSSLNDPQWATYTAAEISEAIGVASKMLNVPGEGQEWSPEYESGGDEPRLTDPLKEPQLPWKEVPQGMQEKIPGWGKFPGYVDDPGFPGRMRWSSEQWTCPQGHPSQAVGGAIEDNLENGLPIYCRRCNRSYDPKEYMAPALFDTSEMPYQQGVQEGGPMRATLGEPQRIGSPVTPEWLGDRIYPRQHFYHGTSAENAQRILKEGLKPWDDPSVDQNWGNQYEYEWLEPRPGHVYLGTNPDIVREHGSYRSNEFRPSPGAILQIDPAYLDPRNVNPDEDATNSSAADAWERPEGSPHKTLGEQAEAENWGADPSTTEGQIDHSGLLAYRGIIPPEAISVHSEFHPDTGWQDAQYTTPHQGASDLWSLEASQPSIPNNSKNPEFAGNLNAESFGIVPESSEKIIGENGNFNHITSIGESVQHGSTVQIDKDGSGRSLPRSGRSEAGVLGSEGQMRDLQTNDALRVSDRSHPSTLKAGHSLSQQRAGRPRDMQWPQGGEARSSVVLEGNEAPRRTSVARNSARGGGDVSSNIGSPVAAELLEWLNSFGDDVPTDDWISPHHRNEMDILPTQTPPTAAQGHPIDPPEHPFEPYNWASDGHTSAEHHPDGKPDGEEDEVEIPGEVSDPYEEMKTNWYQRAWDAPGSPMPWPPQIHHWKHDHDPQIKSSGMTHRQLVDQAASLPQDNSVPIYRFPDGWTISQPTTYSDIDREGQLMGNCLAASGQGYDESHPVWNEYNQDDSGDPLAWDDPNRYSPQELMGDEIDEKYPFYSLRDPDNIPHLSFEHHYDDRAINNALGRHNSDAKLEHVRRLNEWIQNDPHTNVDKYYDYGPLADSGWPRPISWDDWVQHHEDWDAKTGPFAYMR